MDELIEDMINELMAVPDSYPECDGSYRHLLISFRKVVRLEAFTEARKKVLEKKLGTYGTVAAVDINMTFDELMEDTDG